MTIDVPLETFRSYTEIDQQLKDLNFHNVLIIGGNKATLKNANNTPEGSRFSSRILTYHNGWNRLYKEVVRQGHTITDSLVQLDGPEKHSGTYKPLQSPVAATDLTSLEMLIYEGIRGDQVYIVASGDKSGKVSTYVTTTASEVESSSIIGITEESFSKGLYFLDRLDFNRAILGKIVERDGMVRTLDSFRSI